MVVNREIGLFPYETLHRIPVFLVPCGTMKSKLNQQTRLILAFVILCVMTGGILFTGPGFNFALQVILASLMLFFLFWLIT